MNLISVMEESILEKGQRKEWKPQLEELKKNFGVKCVHKKFTKANTPRDGFIQEYKTMQRAGFSPNDNGFKLYKSNPEKCKFYNKINSPGLKMYFEDLLK